MKKMLSILLLGSMFYFQHAESQCIQKTCPRCGKCYPCVVVKTNTGNYVCDEQRYWRWHCARVKGWYDTMEYPSYRSWRLWNQLAR